ncbi:MAG: hypothetical protein JSS23_12310 [Proteobacteria bacterium]|nr:hypothetical protein [Pseudomonadota bacterium]
MPDFPDLELFTGEQQHTTKLKHRAVQVEIQNPLDGPITIRYHQETVDYLDGAPGKRTPAGSIEFTLDQTAAAKSFDLNGKSVTGADVAQWITRDYIDRRTAQLNG